MFKFSTRSKTYLAAVHPDLRRVMEASIAGSPLDFGITEGVRTWVRQKSLVEAGKSTTMNSRHLTGHAVDILVYVNGRMNWDLENYRIVTDHIKAVAKELGVSITCGIDWKNLVDGPHIQLSWEAYPDRV